MRSLVRLGLIYHAAKDQTADGSAIDGDGPPIDSKDPSLPTSSETIRAAFSKLADDWCSSHGESWAQAAPDIWTKIEKGFDLVTQPLRDRLGNTGIYTLIETYHLGKLTSPAPPHIEALVKLANDDLDISELSRKLGSYRRTVSTTEDDYFAIQGGESRATFEELYVQRYLKDLKSHEIIASEAAFNFSHYSPRIVVVGDPGAGKSTLMRWLAWKTARSARDGASIPLTVICRTDLAPGGISVLEACKVEAERRLGELLTPDDFNCLLALGHFSLLIDGVDEIPERSHRQSIVRQLQVLEEKYPLASIICSTRRLGFEVQIFGESDYKMLQLEEYDDQQVEVYADKWFRNTNQSVRTARFLGESRHLPDLRSNPLMLALLCTLYSQHDYIPQSRREIYVRCAALMFHEWDPQRGIQIPNVFKARGDRILYDIARFIDERGGIGTAISRRDLERVVREHLEQAGILPTEAVASTNQFVEHCSTRAWILSATGRGSDLRK